MHLLVLGANGLLGSNVVRAGRRRGWTVGGTYHSTRPAVEIPLIQFDLREAETFDQVLAAHDPDVVVNCAALTDVDGCEQRPEQAHEVNGAAPGEVAAQCAAADVAFVHVSTDYVFDGTARDPYIEADDPAPVQQYGASKLAGERAVRAATDAALIARLSFVWGIHRDRGDLTGFPAWVRDQLQAGERVPLFTDQWITPTRAGQAAETLLALVAQQAGGLYHVASDSCVTPYAFGALLADRIGADASLLEEGSTADVSRAATRPSYTCLDVGKVETMLDRAQPSLRDDIATVSEELD